MPTSVRRAWRRVYFVTGKHSDGRLLCIRYPQGGSGAESWLRFVSLLLGGRKKPERIGGLACPDCRRCWRGDVGAEIDIV